MCAPAAALRKAGAGAHYLQQLELVQGCGSRKSFASASAASGGAAGCSGTVAGAAAGGAGGGAGGSSCCTVPGVLSSSPADACRRLPYPLNSLCLLPLADNTFRAVNRGYQRELQRQRVAGVDVWRLSGGCILPRLEGSALCCCLVEGGPRALQSLQEALLSCVQFLYREGIKPFAGEIAHQLRKRTEAAAWLPSEVVGLAMTTPEVFAKIERRVKGEDGWVVLLKKQKEPPEFKGFVDTRAKDNVYSQEQWIEFNK